MPKPKLLAVGTRTTRAAIQPWCWSAAARLAVTGALIIAAAVALTSWLIILRVETVMNTRAMARVTMSLHIAHELLQAKAGAAPG